MSAPKIFLVTSMAGQGKTNFVCDLVENQFKPFAIPCLYIPARELNSFATGRRIFEYISNNRFAPDVNKVHDFLVLFNNVATESGKPFLIVIDGINEVSDLTAFSDELKRFLNSVCQYEMVKVVVTCRSEFFDDKYASILDEPFAIHIHRVNDLRSKMTGLSKARLLKSYLIHFNIRGNLSRIARNFLKNDMLLLRIFCERYANDDVGYLADIYKGEIFEKYLTRKIEAFPPELQIIALPTLYRIVNAMLAADNFSKLSVRDFAIKEQEVVRRFIEEDVILRQEVGAQGLSAIGDLSISFTYDELRDFIIAFKLVVGDAASAGQSLLVAIAKLPERPIFEGVYRYAYLLARNRNDAAAIAACENANDFIEHYSLNVHLLPPSAQLPDDVTRIKSLLADSSRPERLRRAAHVLVHRENVAELLNITILRDHMNGLDSEEHTTFLSAMFGHRHDYERAEWQKRIDELIHDVEEASAEDGLDRYPPEWLAFFLHASSLASWSERELVSTMFRKAKSATHCRDAVELVRSARSEAVKELLADIEYVEETAP